MMTNAAAESGGTGVRLYWLPLGAGGRFVRRNGRLYEAACAWWESRAVADLYHCALDVVLDADHYVIEMAPVWSSSAPGRGVVGEGPVGFRLLGHFAAFRYEIRRWHHGIIADVAEAVDSPVLVSGDPHRAGLLLHLVSRAPVLTWGRDEIRTGDMWNSNSLIAWLLARTGHEMDTVAPPAHGRAPGWRAGLVLAARQQRGTGSTPGHADGPGGTGLSALPDAIDGHDYQRRRHREEP